jgi:hypothetical protein
MTPQAYRPLALLLALALTLAGCGKTTQDVIDEQRPAMNALRTHLSDIALALPDQASRQSAPADLSPPPRYGTEDANTDILMYDQMFDPEDGMRDPSDLDLFLSNIVLLPLRWSGPVNPLSESFLDDAAGNFDQQFTRAAGLSYIGVARVRGYEPPVAIDAKNYTGGSAEIDGFLVSLSTNEVLCSFSVSAAPDESVSYTYKENEDPRSQLEGFVRSSIWQDGRTKLLSSFGEFCGGEFVAD